MSSNVESEMGGQRVADRRLKTSDIISEEEMNVSNKDQDIMSLRM